MSKNTKPVDLYALTDDDIIILRDLLVYGNAGRPAAKRAGEIQLEVRRVAAFIEKQR